MKLKWAVLGVLAGTMCAAGVGGAPPEAPGLTLGKRAEALRSATTVVPVVVVVSDETSYLSAISGWRLAGPGGKPEDSLIYPVLLDDGSFMSREAIARFVRAFGGRDVVQWRDARAAATQERTAGRDSIEAAVAAAWGSQDAAALGAKWKELAWTPPGVIVACETDPAWTAAVALSAARGEPIAWVDDAAWTARGSGDDDEEGGRVRGQRGASGGGRGKYSPLAMADALKVGAAAAEYCRGLGAAYAGLGDAVDAVTLCLNAPARVAAGEKDFLSLTDVVGREESGGSPGKVRWAWCGQIVGGESEAAMAAMGALFLPSAKGERRAMILSAYDDSPPWNGYDVRGAANALKPLGFAADITAGLSGENGGVMRGATADALRDRACAAPLGLDLLLINSSGNAEFFDMRAGRCYPGDLPILESPFAAYVVHSFSAARPTDRGTVGGRLLERGCYAYLGSVDEPMLNAFVPTPEFARRLAEGWALGAAVRTDPGDAWKLTYLGDPLISFSAAAPAGVPVEARDPPLKGARPMATVAAGHAKSGHRAQQFWAMSMAGRDEEVFAAFKADLGNTGSPPAADAARAAVGSAYRRAVRTEAPAEDREAMMRLLELVTPDRAVLDRREEGAFIKDVAWQFCRARLRAVAPEGGGARELAILKRCVRHEQPGRDAAEVGALVGAIEGEKAADEFVQSVRETLKTDREKERFDKDVKRSSK